MSYPQAFHTSCRTGLSGSPGFQYNAASRELDERQLARIATVHTGYTPPPDAPPEPDPEQIARLPVALRYAPVEGVGPVLSRTVYVGRELRGADGVADSGRFGNYFSHIVVGDDDEAAAGFGELLPIELWEAPHWTSEEASGTDLASLAELEPGPLDAELVIGQLCAARRPALAVVADAALRAVLGGPRAVIVEADPALAAPWVAWSCFALPSVLAAELTFSTFDARPRAAAAVGFSVTTPACDADFSDYELGSSVTLVDTSSPSPVDGLSLYGRVLDSIVDEGAEAVTAAVSGWRRSRQLEPLGAGLAVAAHRVALARPTELPAVVSTLAQRLGSVGPAELAALAAELPRGDGSAEELAAWSELYAAARNKVDGGALVDASLERMLGSLAAPTVELPAVEFDAPAAPSASALTKWLEAVAVASTEGQLGGAIEVGRRLGLIGCNTALDRELGALVAEHFADDAVQAAYAGAARDGCRGFVEAVAVALAERVGAGGDVKLLEVAAKEREAREAVRIRAEHSGRFESVAAWEMLRAGSGDLRREAVAALAARAETAAHEATVRGLFGPDGPVEPDQHVELLEGWVTAGAQAPPSDWEAALSCLATLSFWDSAEPAAALFGVLRAGPLPVRGDEELRAWALFFDAGSKLDTPLEWARAAASLYRERRPSLSDERAEELRELAARFAVRSMAADADGSAVELLLHEMGSGWEAVLGDALARRVANSADPVKPIAGAFVRWHAPERAARKALLERALPRATRDLSPRQLDEVAAHLPERWLPHWEDWLADHPPRRVVSRTVRGVLRRGGD